MDSGFLGYRLRMWEEQLGRVERKLDAVCRLFTQTGTPEERATFVADLLKEAGKVSAAVDALDAGADKLNKT